jgi:hypothetical protein
MTNIRKYLVLIVLIISQGLIPVFREGLRDKEQPASQAQSFWAPEAMPAAPVFHNQRSLKISEPTRFLSFADLSAVLSVSASVEPIGPVQTAAGKPVCLHFPHTLLTLGCLLTV